MNCSIESDPNKWHVTKKQADMSARVLKEMLADKPTCEIKLLPLPGWAHKADKLLCDTDWLRTQVSDYARANVAHHTDMLEVQLLIANEKLRLREELITELLKRLDNNEVNT